MTAQEKELNQYFSAIKMALMAYASNILYIKNINRSIARPKDQKFIIKTCRHIENLQQSLLNYLTEWSDLNHDTHTKPLLYCSPTITEIHLNHYSSKDFLNLLDIQKQLFIENINSTFLALKNNSTSENQIIMLKHHQKILKIIGAISSLRFPKQKAETSVQSIPIEGQDASALNSSPDSLSIERATHENEDLDLNNTKLPIIHGEQEDTKKLLIEIDQLREKMSRIEQEKIASEEQRHRIEAERVKLVNDQKVREEAVNTEREKVAAEQQRLREETERKLLEAKKHAAEEAACIEREKIAAEQQHLREETERKLLEAKKHAAEEATRIEREKVAAEQQRLREETERKLLEAKKHAAEETACIESEKIAAEQQLQHEKNEKQKLEQQAQQKLLANKSNQEELEKLNVKEQELHKKRNELQEIEDALHDKEREQQLIIQELLTASRQLHQKENELQEVVKTKYALEQQMKEINAKLHGYENQKRENAEMLLKLERTRRQFAQDASLLEHAWQRQVRNLQPEMITIKPPGRKRHSLELEEAAARLKQTGTEERT